MTAVVRALQPSDLPRLIELIDGLAEYEQLAPPDDAARERLAADALADPPRFRTLLAEVDGSVVGYAVYFFTYSTFCARPRLYLEDLFVLPAFRGSGAGLALFRSCAREAVKIECASMDWQVLSWNQPSIDFYQRFGAQHLDGWLPFRLEEQALATLGELD